MLRVGKYTPVPIRIVVLIYFLIGISYIIPGSHKHTTSWLSLKRSNQLTCDGTRQQCKSNKKVRTWGDICFLQEHYWSQCQVFQTWNRAQAHFDIFSVSFLSGSLLRFILLMVLRPIPMQLELQPVEKSTFQYVRRSICPENVRNWSSSPQKDFEVSPIPIQSCFPLLEGPRCRKSPSALFLIKLFCFFRYSSG